MHRVHLDLQPPDFEIEQVKTNGTKPNSRCLFGGCQSEKLFFMYGGYSAKQELDDLFSFSAETSTWNLLKKSSMSQSSPGRRKDHSICYFPSSRVLVLFGGEKRNNSASTKKSRFGSQKRRMATNDLFLFRLTRNVWIKVNPLSKKPSHRYGHSAVVRTTTLGEFMYIFGGYPDLSDSNLYKFSISDMKWEVVEDSGDIPKARYGHSAIITKDRRKMVIAFGEIENHEKTNDIYTFNFESKEWEELEITGPQPSPRTGQSCCITNEGRIFFYGGYIDDTNNEISVGTDFWELNIHRGEWIKLKLYSEVPNSKKFMKHQKVISKVSRCAHYSFCFGSGIYVFGGFNNKAQISRNVYLIRRLRRCTDCLEEEFEYKYSNLFSNSSISNPNISNSMVNLSKISNIEKNNSQPLEKEEFYVFKNIPKNLKRCIQYDEISESDSNNQDLKKSKIRKLQNSKKRKRVYLKDVTCRFHHHLGRSKKLQISTKKQLVRDLLKLFPSKINRKSFELKNYYSVKFFDYSRKKFIGLEEIGEEELIDYFIGKKKAFFLIDINIPKLDLKNNKFLKNCGGNNEEKNIESICALKEEKIRRMRNLEKFEKLDNKNMRFFKNKENNVVDQPIQKKKRKKVLRIDLNFNSKLNKFSKIKEKEKKEFVKKKKRNNYNRSKSIPKNMKFNKKKEKRNLRVKCKRRPKSVYQRKFSKFKMFEKPPKRVIRKKVKFLNPLIKEKKAGGRRKSRDRAKRRELKQPREKKHIENMKKNVRINRRISKRVSRISRINVKKKYTCLVSITFCNNIQFRKVIYAKDIREFRDGLFKFLKSREDIKLRIRGRKKYDFIIEYFDPDFDDFLVLYTMIDIPKLLKIRVRKKKSRK